MEAEMTQAQTGNYTNRSTGDGASIRVVGSTEARPGFLTSEMWMTWIAAIVFVIGAYVSDTFNNDLGWILAAAVFFAYILSRGLAKSGSREGPFYASTQSRD
jgi:hypothetical protein